MATHKIVLCELTKRSDLAGVLHVVSAVLKVSPEQAKVMVQRLPLTLVDHCTAAQAEKLLRILAELHAGAEAQPPLPIATSPLVATPADPATHAKVKRWFRSWPALLSVLLILAVSGAGVLVGGQYIRKLFHSIPQGIDKAQVEKQLAAKPNDVTLLIQKSVALLALAHKRMEVDGWKHYGAITSDVPTEGQDLMPLPELDTALSALYQAEKLAPQNPEVYRWLGEVYLQKGLAPEARAFVERAIALQDTNPAYRNLLGLCFLAEGQPVKAQDALFHAYRLSPDYLQTYRNLGMLMMDHLDDTARGVEWLFQYLVRDGGKDPDRYALRKQLVAAAWAVFNPPF